PAATTTKPFALWAEIHPALTQCRRLGQNSRLQDPEWWRAEHTAFPLVDFVAEVKKAEAWCASNPGKAPRRDVPRFLHRWFGKAHAADAGGTARWRHQDPPPEDHVRGGRHVPSRSGRRRRDAGLPSVRGLPPGR